MKITFKEINTKHHCLCGAFLFYRLWNGLYRKYLVLDMDTNSEYITVKRVREQWKDRVRMLANVLLGYKRNVSEHSNYTSNALIKSR